MSQVLGTVLVEPSVSIDNIVVEIDTYSVDAENRLNWMGTLSPLVKFGDKVFNTSEILDFTLNVKIYSLPTLSLSINDPDRIIRKYFKNNPNVGVCRIGFPNWAFKFNIYFNDENSYYNDSTIHIEGFLWNMKMFQPIDYAETNISLKDFFTKLSKSVGNGLYYYPNQFIDKPLENIVIPNQTYINIIKNYIALFSDCFWYIDPNYYLHIGDYNTLIAQDTSMYTLSFSNGEKLESEHPMIFYMNRIAIEPESSKKDNDYKIPIKGYDVNSVSGIEFLKSSKSYSVFTDSIMNSYMYDYVDESGFGIGKSTTNTFSGFKSHPNPYFSKYKNKVLNKKKIILHVDGLLPELNLFDVIELEIYKAYKFDDKDIKLNDNVEDIGELDLENSGKKLVIGYTINYKKPNNLETINKSRIEYTITCV